MTGITQTFSYACSGPVRLPPGHLEPVEELSGDSDIEEDDSQDLDKVSEIALSNIEEEEEETEGRSLNERDPVFEKIKESLSKSQIRSESVASVLSTESDVSDGPHVQISEQYTSIPYGIQPRATYEHSNLHSDIMAVAYNGRMRQFVILDAKGITTWKRDLVDPRVRRVVQYPKYEYRLINNIVYAPKYNCYFVLGKDFSVKVLNRDFEETCSVHTDMRSVLYILFNPVRDELITGGVGGIKIWQFQQVAGKAFTELKPLANYELTIKDTLPNVGGSWVRHVDLDHHLQHLYCCSDTDLHVYDLAGKLQLKFERAHTMTITGCCFSTSAKVLITSSVDSEVKVWSLIGGLVHTFRGHSRAVTGLLLHPETSSLIITTSLDGSVRMWSLDTMDLLYMIIVSADGVMWMGLTDDKLLYISTCRNITLWHLNNFFSFWSLARCQISHMTLASCEEKTTRVIAVGDDNRTDPACRIAIWDVHDLQLPYINGDASNLPLGVIIQPPSLSVNTHRATENGSGNEMISNCCSMCILNSTAMMWTDEGLCCPIRHTYLLLGMEDGRILFMDPVIKGQKYMEFKASKDAIQDMQHDATNCCLITLCHLKTLVLIQIWGLPQLDAVHEMYCAPDVTCFARLGWSMMTGHSSGHINFYILEQNEDQGLFKPRQEPTYESVVDETKRPEHHAPVVAVDSLTSLHIFITCSCDGAIKVWDGNKVLLTEVMLEESLSAACFLNEMGDLLVGFKNHIFYIDHKKLCPTFKLPEIEMETSDQESDVYEDPMVLYELIKQDEEPVTLENYLVPYYHLEFDKDFLEGKTKIEQPKTIEEALQENIETESESDFSLAPSSIYISPAESIESLSMIDLTLGADYSKHDLHQQMKSTLNYLGKKVKASYKGTIDTPAQSDLEDKEIEMELEKFSLPVFGLSPGGSPSITPPSGQASPRHMHERQEIEDWSDDDKGPRKYSGFIPIVPDQTENPSGKLEVLQTQISDIDQDSPRMVKGSTKVDMRGLMKKRRITSARAPSLTRRSSADHSHDDHEHGEHGHDDKKIRKEIKKKQQSEERKLPQRMDMSKLINLPPNPPSMLNRKQSLSQQRKSLEINILNRPEVHQPGDYNESSLIRFDDEADADKLQEEQWASEAAVHGQPMTLPPHKDKNRARLSENLDKNHSRTDRMKDTKNKFGERDSVEGQTPGVGSSPTAELEDDKDVKGKNRQNSEKQMINKTEKAAVEDGHVNQEAEKNNVINLDTNTPETQMQRAKRLGLKVDKVFENEKEKSEAVPKILVQKSKLNVYIPQAERESISSGRSTRHGTPDSGIDESISSPMGLLPLQGAHLQPSEDTDHLQTDALLDKSTQMLVSEADKENTSKQPLAYFTGLQRGTIDGESLQADHTTTTHVKYKMELEFIVELPEKLEDLQVVFDEALQKYRSLPGYHQVPEDESSSKIHQQCYTSHLLSRVQPLLIKKIYPDHSVWVWLSKITAQVNAACPAGTPTLISADTLYKNDGLSFDENWHERAIERHTLLRMQKKIRTQSAAQRRQAMVMIQQAKQNNKLFASRCNSAAAGLTMAGTPSIHSVHANTSMSLPISLGYGVNSVPPPTREKPRPKTAHPTLEKQRIIKKEMSHEKSFRYKLNTNVNVTSRPSSSQSVAEFSTHCIDPRNPDAWRPKSSRSIPSKCNRYILVNKPKEKLSIPVPSPLEEQLLIDRFPKMGAKLVQAMPELAPQIKKSYSMEYSPFVYQRFV